MKRPVKFLIVAVAVLVALPIVAWTGTFLYWHLQIGRTLRALESDPKGFMTTKLSQMASHEVHVALGEAGCRALPYLFASLDPEKDPQFLIAVESAITWTSLPGPIKMDEDRRTIFTTSIQIEDPPEIRRRKCDQLRGWWREHHHRYHQWWRVWSSNCRDAREGPAE